MNILVIGSGAREHAIVWKLLQSSRVRDVYVAPGNAGTGLIARNLPVQSDDIQGLLRAAREVNADLTVVGPEVPLAEGIVDTLQQARFRVFGPTRAAARIESSKSFAKELMERHGIPHARGASFSQIPPALDFVYRTGTPIVVKADGLAAGKGVIICETPEEAEEALQTIMSRRAFGAAGNRVVVEEYLEGPEVSLLAFCDGEHVAPMVPATDYKRVGDADQGPNTGGMGAFSPPPFFSSSQVEEARRTILEPAVRALKAEGAPFSGVLYAGLMVTADGPKVLEFNCRFGDPETQVVLPRLRTDFLDVLEACADGGLRDIDLSWDEQACVGIVMASGGYPDKYDTGFPIVGLDEMEDGVRVFHAGTRARPLAPNTGLRRLYARDLPAPSVAQMLSGDIVTAGGRVLTVVALGRTVEAARVKAYRNADRIRFQDAHYRRDIALSSAASEEPGAGEAAEPSGILPDR